MPTSPPSQPPAAEAPEARAQRVLADHDLPPTLLPPGMAAAEVDAQGRFFVVYPAPVERLIGGYRVRFGPRIEGQLAPGRASGLRGVEARQGLWFGVQAITGAGEQLVFSVGPARVRLPRAAFARP